jgi:ATP-binding cassette subfamily B protein
MDQQKNDKQKGNKQKVKRILSNNWFILKLSFKTAPLFMVLMIVKAIQAQCLIFLEHIYGIKFVLEAVEFHKPFTVVVQFLSIVMIAWAFSFLLGVIYTNNVLQKGLPKIQMRLKEIMYERAKELDLECYDNPDYYNEFVLSLSEADKSVTRTHQIVETFFEAVTMMVTTGVFFLFTDALSVPFVLASFGMTFFFSQLLNKLNYNNRIEKNPKERKRSYIHRVFYLNEYAKEVRLNPSIRPRLAREFESANQEIYGIEKKYAVKRTCLHFITNYLTNDFISDVVYIIYLVFRAAVQHVISYSSVVVLWNSSGSLKHSLRTMATIFPQISENSLYIEKIRNFISYEKKIVSTKDLPMPKKPKTLEFKHVSFGYTEKDGYILHDVCLTIKPNQKIALVGYNGAGKTTLIKLIMRLYDPSEGDILYNGINIKDYNINEYREMIGTIFQDFKIFATNVGYNVVLDYTDTDTITRREKDIRSALEFSGFKEKLDALPQDLLTELTTEFEEDGIDLSGGESQKLAIARAFYKDAQLVILDEPSSALDPIAEYQLNKAMLQTVDSRTVIFISHRLSTTRHADRIIMLEQGQIIEEGTHEELLRLQGKYATMWKAQAGKYVDIA